VKAMRPQGGPTPAMAGLVEAARIFSAEAHPTADSPSIATDRLHADALGWAREKGPMQLNEYITYDAMELAKLVRAGEVRPSELLEISLQLLQLLNPHVNAAVVDTAALAKRDADNLRPGTPFGGVPFLLKDVHPL
jgi:hypothetical protein